MARIADRNPAGAAGEWFVDSACIGCDASRQVAPGLIGTDPAGRSVFLRQPETDEELRMAWRAAEVCPTRSVGHVSLRRPPEPAYPHDLGDNVFRLGHNARESFGAHSYLVKRPTGNLMVDSPRWTREVYEPLEEAGGLAAILLTHRDDVAAADRYAERFGAEVWIHRDDADGAPYATDLIEGIEPVAVRPEVFAFPVPGHTKGSVLYLVDGRLLFSGDSLAWDPQRRRLMAFRDACWYSWSEQRRSLARFAASGYGFDRLFCGHGWSHDASAETFAESLRALVERMA
jgi:glyoxylase-like metal-dependent hydrolase (beta-lactamase superfamily II)/ferredoxin